MTSSSNTPESGTGRFARRCCVFGGSFDPPHLAHLEMARLARDRLDLDIVLFSPLNRPWHKAVCEASWEDRASMTGLLVRNEAGMAVTDVDRRIGGTTYTCKTLERLSREECRGDELFFLMGADSMEYFAQWRDWRRILELARPVVVSRPGHTPVAPGLAAEDMERFIVIDGFECDFSSREIRRRLRMGVQVEGLTGEVYRYIVRHRLYGASAAG